MADTQDSQPSGSSAGAAPAAASSSTPTAGGGNSVQQLKNQLSNKFQANKPLVLKVHSILIWDVDYYPLLIFAATSIAFLFLHLLNSSILTTLSYAGILVALSDLALPFITKNLSKAQAKQTVDNSRYEKICLDLARVIAFLRGSCDTCCALKTKKPKIYYPALLVSLLVLAFIGSKFNNLFLTYIVTLFIVMYPGLDRKGIPQKVADLIYGKLGKKAPQIGGSFAAAPAAGDSRRSSSGKRN